MNDEEDNAESDTLDVASGISKFTARGGQQVAGSIKKRKAQVPKSDKQKFEDVDGHH